MKQHLPFFASITIFWALFAAQLPAQVTKDGAEARAHLARELVRLDSLVKNEAYKAALPLSDSLLRQAKSLTETNTTDSLYARVLFTRGRALFYAGEYRAAIASHEEALGLHRQIYGAESAAVAKSLTNLGICHAEEREAKKAIEQHQQAIAIYQKLGDPWSPALADAWNNLANAQADDRKNEEALKSYEQGLRIRYRNEGPNSPGVATIYQNAAGCHLSLGDLDEAMKGYHAALAIFKKNPKTRPVSVAHVWYNLGICYELISDLEAALYCSEQALALRQAHLRPDHPNLLASYRGLTSVYRSLGDFDKSELYINKVLEVRRATLKPGNSRLTSTLVDAGVVAGDRRDWEKAEEMFRQAMQSEWAAEKPDSLNIARTLSRYGTFKYKQNLLDSAIMLQNRALDYHPVNFSGMDAIRSSIYANIGECYLLKKEIAKADSSFRLSHTLRTERGMREDPAYLAYLYRKLAECRMYQERFEEATALLDSVFLVLNVPDSLNWEQARSPYELALALKTRSQLYLHWAQQANIPDYLLSALHWGKAALSYMGKMEQEMAASSSRRAIRDMAREARALCVEASFHLQQKDTGKNGEWLERCFGHIEAAHNTQLRDVIADAKNRPPTGKIDPLRVQTQDLRNTIAETEKRIHLMRDAGFVTANDTLRHYTNVLFDLKNQLDTLLADPLTAWQNIANPVSSATVRQTLLRPGQTLLEYFVADSMVYVLCANKRAAHLAAIRLDFDLDTCVARMRQGLTGYYGLSFSDPRRTPELFQRTLNDYVEAALLLYQQIVAPIEIYVGADRDLLIVPDGVLNLLPFQALLRERPLLLGDFASYPYLVKKYNIGTGFSASVGLEMGKTGQNPASKGQSLVMAPYYLGDPTLLPDMAAKSISRARFDTLWHSGLEASVVHRFLKNSKVVYGAHATLDTFFKYAPHSKVIHLSTHSAADNRFGEYCYVVFERDGDTGHKKLYVNDIYRRRFQADLVTLSSCESAVGEFQRGEGLVGLTRAFAYSGAKSIVSSLWQINDASTAEIMAGFYEGIAQRGLHKDHALAETCRAYLKVPDKSNEINHPFFWAAFIVSGDLLPLK